MTHFRQRCALVLACAATVAATIPASARAQGALSLEGFGYPIGGTSARALGSGGSLIDLDPQSPVNPASIVLSSRLQGYVQYEPEFRSVSAGGETAKTTTSRFPLFMVTGRQGRATFALSFSSFMDRTWSNSYADTQTVGTEHIASTVLTSSVGGIADVRGAMAWSFNENLHVGAALHVYPGEDRVTFGRVFADSLAIGSFQLSNVFSFSGSALSLGAVWITKQHLVFAGDLRAGGTLRLRLGDSTIVGSGRIPLHLGASASYDGIPGTVFSLHVAKDQWTDLRGLGSESLGIQDATDVAVGTEVAGPRVGGSQMLVRAGFRTRGLPFTYGTTPVKENSFSTGVGIPIAGTRAIMDLGLVRASRTASSVSEKAWLVSVGIGIKP